MVTCPKCGNQAGEGAIFCDQCGAPLPKAEPAPQPAAPAPAGGSVICPACGAGNVPGEAFCDFCGSPLEAPVPTPVSAPTPPAPAEAAPVPPAEEQPTCPACGEKVLPGEAFCANCGASLAQPPIPPEPVPEVAAAPVAAEAPTVPEAVPVEPMAPPAVAPEVPAAPPAAVPAPTPTCPACGAEVEAGDRFCSNCGAAQAAAPAPEPVPEALVAPPPAEAVAVPAPVPAGPRLVVVASGAEIPLPTKDEILLGREDPVSGIFPDIDLTPHGGEEAGVSRRHAQLTMEGGVYFLEDLNSTNFTFVNKQKLVPKTRQPLKDGDEIRCGRVALLLRIGG